MTVVKDELEREGALQEGDDYLVVGGLTGLLGFRRSARLL